ncbi:MAG TPA: PilZ domain-containing protein, partial [Myxococcota bacterium]|nr:PilZ domain-containing protein [Myxococcota bacterium]
RVGSRMRLALYDPTREAPLVVDAVVSRDDGARGFGLEFLAMTPELAARLEQLVATLPPVEQLGDGESGALGSVVGEIVS